MRTIILALVLSIPSSVLAHTDICTRVDATTLQCTRLVKGEKPIQIVCKIEGLKVTCSEVK